MAKDQEYLTGNRKIRYPFADDSLLSVNDSKAITVFGCFVDAMVQIKSSDLDITPTISNISISHDILTFSLNGRTGIDTPVTLTCAKSKTSFPIIKGKTDWCWYAFVLSSDGIREYAELEGSSDPIGNISGSVLHLNTRCIGYPAKGVTKVSVYGGKGWNQAEGRRYTRLEAIQLSPDAEVTGAIRFVPGYNMVIGEDISEISLERSVQPDGLKFSAVPGAGAGTAPCDSQEAVTFKTEGLLSVDGHTRLFNDTCYDLVPIKYSEESAELKMHAKCKACCTCQMYVSIVNDRLVPLKDKILSQKRSFDKTYKLYETNVAKWNKRITNAYPEDIIISTTGIPLDAAATNLKNSDVAGTMSRCGFSVMVRNDSFVTVSIEFSDFITNGEVFEAQFSYMDESFEPKVIPMPAGSVSGTVELAPGRSVVLTCFVRSKTYVQKSEQSGFIAKVKVTARQGSRIIFSRVKGVTI